MAAESARSFDELEAQAQTLLGIFTKANYEPVAPAIIQPADVFLDVIGEAIRGRTYLFTDPDGEELCLRPDLTVPTARLYLERNPKADTRARYCYNGSAFRFQPGGGDACHPREFRQAGTEAFGNVDREKAEAETLALAIEAMRASGLKSYRIRLGDLGLFNALLDAIDMPERWRERLRRTFWRRQAFQDELSRLCNGGRASKPPVPEDLLRNLDPAKPRQAEDRVASYLERERIPMMGTRTLSEITARLLDWAADTREAPLNGEAAQLINDYVTVKAPPRAAGARINDLMTERGFNLSDALDVYRRRIDLLAQTGIRWADAEFEAEFGRNLAYYTGFVFQIEVPQLGESGVIAGGGRYDGLLRDVSAPHNVPAVGHAIHTERLLFAIREGI